MAHSISIDPASLLGKYVVATYDDGSKRSGVVKSATFIRLGSMVTTTSGYQLTLGNNLRQLEVWDNEP